MTSINFNASATTALRTLQQTNAALETTQNRVATGLKIGSAKDNAAYWSISTTLQSDNKSLSTVKDALNLGAATVDVAYQGLNKTKEVLDEIKSKLTAASQDGVDRAAIQSEIKELQNQLKSIATSSTFSNENWLSVNSGTASYNAAKTVVSSFQRDAAGNFSINTIDIDTSTFALIDASGSGEAILDAGKSGNALVGGLEAMTAAAVGTATSGASVAAAPFVYTAGSGGGEDQSAETLAMAITIDGASFGFTLTDSTTFDTLDELVVQINQRIGGAGTASDDGTGTLQIVSSTTGTASTVNITAAVFTGTGAVAATLAGVTDGDTSTFGTAVAAVSTMAVYGVGTTIVLDENDSIGLQVELNGAASKTVTIDRATVLSALGAASEGKITTVGEYATVLNKAFENAGLGDVTATVNGGAIEFTSTVLGAESSINISSVAPNAGVSILDIDVSSATDVELARYLNAVSDATTKVTSAAATLGAVSSRIDLQTEYVTNLIDTIDKGVSDLIDADLSEESTRLQALQTKQQLGIQALSIANSSTQSVLSLFQ
ncbi:flagellin [Aureimonas sp. SA4125]|uniref:flagellin N-terminal helical domain-containing protein n=1 Tax=Aureimonas sp. SA4125 TaxID=2826993 RepID=UPI0023DEB010|nr:flagellin [Aureimonas sp. SA4125]